MATHTTDDPSIQTASCPEANWFSQPPPFAIFVWYDDSDPAAVTWTVDTAGAPPTWTED